MMDYFGRKTIEAREPSKGSGTLVDHERQLDRLRNAVAGGPRNLDGIVPVTPYNADFTSAAVDLLKDVSHGEKLVPSPRVLPFLQILVKTEYSPLQLKITDSFGSIVVSEGQANIGFVIHAAPGSSDDVIQIGLVNL
jgi:hypothetical protein